MCGRYTLTRQDVVVDEFQAMLGFDASAEGLRAWWKPRFNVAPTQPAPIITLRDGERRVEMFRWGLVPHWAAKPEPGGSRPPLMINARVETIMAKPVFRRAFEHRRILVPADGFFEWKRSTGSGKSKEPPRPLYIRPVPHRTVAFAGIATRAGELYSFAIVTGPPNALVESIHDRMPVVLDPSTYAAWLDPTLPPEGALAMLTVPAVDDWRADFVSTHVNKATNDDEACIEVVPPPSDSTQGTLF